MSLALPCAILALLSFLSWKQAAHYQSAVALWSATVQENPESWLGENNYGTALTDGGEKLAALPHFQRAYELAPSNLESSSNLGRCLVELQQPAAALPYLEQAIRIDRRSAMVRRDLGRALFQLGRESEARAALEELIRDDPDDAKAHTILAGVLTQQGHSDEALVHLRKAMSLKSDDPETMTQLANIYLQSQQNRPAAEMLRHILENHPDDPDALKNYAWLLATAPEPDLRDGTRAVALAERAHAQAPQNPFIKATLAAAFAEAGRFDQAKAVARDALRIAEANNLNGLASLLQAEIAQFDSGQPYRDHL